MFEADAPELESCEAAHYFYNQHMFNDNIFRHVLTYKQTIEQGFFNKLKKLYLKPKETNHNEKRRRIGLSV